MSLLDFLKSRFNGGSESATPPQAAAPSYQQQYVAPPPPPPNGIAAPSLAPSYWQAPPQPQAPRPVAQSWLPASFQPLAAAAPAALAAAKEEARVANEATAAPVQEPEAPKGLTLWDRLGEAFGAPGDAARTPEPPRVLTGLEGQRDRLNGSDSMANQDQSRAAGKKTSLQQNQSLTPGDFSSEQMSVEAYLNLAPNQRAAVDANTALVSAVEKDIADWGSRQVKDRVINDKDYLSGVKGKFGDDGGSDTYAPRTMAVLNDLGLNTEGRDLDQYLNLSALVTADDLKGLAKGAPAPAAGDVRSENAQAFSTAATRRLSETLATGQNLLDSIRGSSEQNAELFGPADNVNGIGTSGNERDADLASAFDIFAQTQSQGDLTPETVDNVYAELQTKHGVTPNEVAQYFDTRLQANEYLNLDPELKDPASLGGVGSSLEYLNPEAFREKYLKRGE